MDFLDATRIDDRISYDLNLRIAMFLTLSSSPIDLVSILSTLLPTLSFLSGALKSNDPSVSLSLLPVLLSSLLPLELVVLV